MEWGSRRLPPVFLSVAGAACATRASSVGVTPPLHDALAATEDAPGAVAAAEVAPPISPSVIFRIFTFTRGPKDLKWSKSQIFQF